MQFNENKRPNRGGLTLIEMLIGMAITLVMMAAVVQLFANISQGVRNRRATMEVSSKLRTARAQLYNDLAGATCLKYPKDTHAAMLKPDSNNMPDGYFEIVEGERADENPAAAGSFDQATSMIPSTGQLYDAEGQPLNPNIVTDGGGLGDYDDILAMTVESQSERFKGRGRGLRPGGNPANIGTLANNFTDGDWIDMAISSPVAEVVWFAIQNPPDRSQGEPGMRKVYRRVVLITPWYGTVTNSYGMGSDPLLDLVNRGITTHQDQLLALRDFQEKYDISVRLENGRLVPNTLADLARREHRLAHAPNSTAVSPNIAFYPHHFPYDVDSPTFTETPDESDSSLRRLSGDRAGEDLILDNVLAFDVQVYDPGAPLYQYPPNSGTIVPPSSSQAFLSATTTPLTNITGFGAYVDLGWNNALNYNYATVLASFPNAPVPLFQEERRLGWHPTIAPPLATYLNLRGTPAVYDTWTTHYETDQSNQELAPFYQNMSPVPPWVAWQTDIIDQGANGLDENGINGPDDPLERETSPPYPYPLYGVQVKLRLYEPESRQIRETSVTRNLSK
jgi:type II secretory pathway pseudopilin PulG